MEAFPDAARSEYFVVMWKQRLCDNAKMKVKLGIPEKKKKKKKKKGRFYDVATLLSKVKSVHFNHFTPDFLKKDFSVIWVWLCPLLKTG